MLASSETSATAAENRARRLRHTRWTAAVRAVNDCCEARRNCLLLECSGFHVLTGISGRRRETGCVKDSEHVKHVGCCRGGHRKGILYGALSRIPPPYFATAVVLRRESMLNSYEWVGDGHGHLVY